MRTLLYSLRTINDKSILSIDLTGLVISENSSSLLLKIDNQNVILYKYEYLNRMKIYDNGKVFFIVCSYKKVSRISAYKCLMAYAIEKLKRRKDNIEANIQKYERELCAA
jgi:hypothetical protein